MTVHIVCLLLVASSLFMGQVGADCVPISQCRSFTYMNEHKNGIPGLRPKAIERLIESERCGQDAGGIKVNCFSDRANNRGALVGNVHSNTASSNGGRTCSGKLHITFQRRYGYPPQTETMEAEKHSDISRSIGYRVFMVEVQGSCCYELFESASFNGRRQLLNEYYKDRPRRFTSFRRTANCS